MELDLDTFLVTVYCIVDDWYKEQVAPERPTRRGPKPELSDSEVLCLAVLAQWQARRSERAFLRSAAQHWRAYFPRLLSPAQVNRRVRDLWGVLCRLGPAVSERAQQVLGLHPAYQVADGVPVPLMKRCRARKQQWFAQEAAIGAGGSDKEWYFGVKLMLVVSPEGFIQGWVEGPANTEERWLMEALLRWRRYAEAAGPRAEDLAEVLGPTHRNGGKRVGPTGPLGSRLGVGAASDLPCLGDLGYQGANWQRHWRQEYGTAVLTKGEFTPRPTVEDQRAACSWFSGLRQVVETVNAGLDRMFGLKFLRARCWWGVLTRLGAKIAAFNLAVYLNYLFGRQPFAFFDPLS